MKKLLSLTIILLLSTNILEARQEASAWQYSSHPELPFILDHVSLDLNIDPQQPLVDGRGIFTIVSRSPVLTEVIFNTAESQIMGISVDGVETEFTVSSDSLIITLPDTLRMGNKAELNISWSTASRYGINSDVYGNVWTSLNPQSRRFWIPLPDHPEVEFTLDATYTIPTGAELVTHGTKVEDELTSMDKKQVRWTSEERIPASGLTFAIGNYQKISARSGIKEISLFASENVMLSEVKEGLLDIAVSAVKKYERKVSFELPYESLNIVVLPDHHWQEIQSGAGVIYLYQNLGSLVTQLRRGIAEQWFGNYHRYLQPTDNRYEFLKVLTAGTADTGQLNNRGDLQSIHRWNIWQQGVDILDEQFMKEVIEGSLGNLLRDIQGVTSWEEYADVWYDRTGYFWDALPDFELPEKNENVTEQQIYNVEYVYDELNGLLTLNFEAQGTPIESLVTVEATSYSFTDTTTRELTFTGASDKVTLNLNSGIDYLTLSTPAHPNLIFVEDKPFLFWISQLRAEDPEDRIQAAKQLKAFSDNPDLQLALRDVMSAEENAEARAAMLETLSAITKDATGTEETFINYVNSEDLALKLSGLRALVHYKDNESAAYTVRNTLIRTNKDTVFNVGLDTYYKIAPVEDMISLAERFEGSEGNDLKALKTLKMAISDDTTGIGLQIADRYATGSYPYMIKREALQLIMKHTTNSEYWNETLDLLKGERDPRIRYLVLDAVEYLGSAQKEELLTEMLNEEQDPRVRNKILSIMK